MTDTNSAHRSPGPAHRSGGEELKTEVFIVKTPDDKDAVIVSFVDGDEVNGIYLYEPGADPVELTSVGLNGVATEFDYAIVEGTWMPDTGEDQEEREWPGDGMVTRAERDAAVAQATEDHGNLQQAYDTLREQAQALVDAAERAHQEQGGGHPGMFRWCQHAVCEAAQAVEL